MVCQRLVGAPAWGLPWSGRSWGNASLPPGPKRTLEGCWGAWPGMNRAPVSGTPLRSGGWSFGTSLGVPVYVIAVKWGVPQAAEPGRQSPGCGGGPNCGPGGTTCLRGTLGALWLCCSLSSKPAEQLVEPGIEAHLVLASRCRGSSVPAQAAPGPCLEYGWCWRRLWGWAQTQPLTSGARHWHWDACWHHLPNQSLTP